MLRCNTSRCGAARCTSSCCSLHVARCITVVAGTHSTSWYYTGWRTRAAKSGYTWTIPAPTCSSTHTPAKRIHAHAQTLDPFERAFIPATLAAVARHLGGRARDAHGKCSSTAALLRSMSHIACCASLSLKATRSVEHSRSMTTSLAQHHALHRCILRGASALHSACCAERSVLRGRTGRARSARERRDLVVQALALADLRAIGYPRVSEYGSPRALIRAQCMPTASLQRHPPGSGRRAPQPSVAEGPAGRQAQKRWRNPCAGSALYLHL